MRKRILLVLILAAGAYFRLHDLDWGLPEVFEEATPWRQAWEMWSFETGRLDFNPHFFHYPALSFYIQWLGQAIIYLAGRISGEFASPHHMQAALEASPHRFIVVGRLITSLFGIASIYLVYRLGKALHSEMAGILAALFLAFNFSHISRGQLITTDIPLVFFVLLAFIPIIRIASKGRARDYIWAGVCVGLAAGVKYPGVFTGAGILAGHVHFHAARRTGWKRVVLSPALWAGAGVVLLVFFAVSPYCLIDYSGFYRDFRFEQTHMAVGHFGAPERLVSYGEYLLSIIPRVLTLPVLGLTLAGIAYGLIRDSRSSLMLLSFPVFYLIVVGSWKTSADHYVLPAVPFFLLFAALVLWKAYGWIEGRRKGLILGLAVCLAVLPSAFQIHDYHTGSAREDNRILAGTWIEENIENGAAIAKERITPRLDGDDYLVFELPLSTIYPRETEPFYDLRLYRDFDYMITSSGVYERYLRKPDEFPVHAGFYDRLDGSADLLMQFDETSGSGPGINIYRLPGPGAGKQPDIVYPQLYPRLMASSDPAANAKTLCNLAIVLSRKNSHMDAIELYQVALSVDSTMVGAWHNLGLTLKSLGRIPDAERALRRAIDIDSTYAMAWIGLGHLHMQTGDLASAIDAYEQGLKHAPYRLDAMRTLADLYMRTGRTDDALRIAETGLEVSGGGHEFHFAAGCIYMLKEDYSRAVEALALAMEGSPQNGRYAYSLAGAYYSAGDYKRAMQFARRAQELGFDSADLVDMIREASARPQPGRQAP